MRYRINRQQYLWFCLTQTANSIMRELRLLVKSKDKLLEIETELWDIVETKKKVIGYRGRWGPKVASVDSQERKEIQCKIL